jgi:death-on-curing protein
VIALHDHLVQEHSGLPGLRDEGLLDSALARPRNLWAYEQAGLLAFAACYAGGIVRDHPFFDGNKRTAFTAASVFLEDNGHALALPEEEMVERMVGRAAAVVDEAGFARWLEAGSGHRKKRRSGADPGAVQRPESVCQPGAAVTAGAPSP